MSQTRLFRTVAVTALSLVLLAPTSALSGTPDGPVVDPALASPAARADLTLALRDLKADDPSTSVGRPTGGSDGVGVKYRSGSRNSCGVYVCVHWVSSSSDKPSLKDKNRDGVPDWVERTRTTADFVIRTFVKAGYRKPVTDKRSKNPGPNGKLDIYLANLGRIGYYGYCDTDDPNRSKKSAVSAYCVIDNDFSPREYHAKSINSLRVTLAHELFHAVQFAYDYREDRWLMEGTATWMEEQIYNSINDNRQFLTTQSPLSNPSQPLDYFNPSSSPAQYGVWSFFQYLSTKYPQRRGKLPAIVRDIWGYADNSTKKRPRQWSTQAINTVLSKRGTSLAAAFADFSQVNLVPRAFYKEGGSWPAARIAGECQLRVDTTPPGCTWANFAVTHLSSVSLKVFPDAVASPTATFAVDLSRVPWGIAKLTLVRLDGTLELYTFDASGQLKPPAFNATSYAYAVVTVANGSTRFSCGKGTDFTCHGKALDDGALATVTAVPST